MQLVALSATNDDAVCCLHEIFDDVGAADAAKIKKEGAGFRQLPLFPPTGRGE